jgi:alpha-N-acetylglucosaminidase
VLTLWGQGPAIDDYARKQWSGMLNGYYGPRWERYLAPVIRAVERREPLDEEALAEDLRPWMAQWSNGTESYPDQPRGDSVACSRALWDRYGHALLPNSATGKK